MRKSELITELTGVVGVEGCFLARLEWESHLNEVIDSCGIGNKCFDLHKNHK